MKKQYPPETWEQSQVVSFCDTKDIPIYAIPNGTHIRSHAGRAKAQAEGLKSGVPDLCIPMPSNGYHGLYIEMKKEDGKVRDVTLNQKAWIKRLNEAGYYAAVAFGHKDAIAGIEKYLKIQNEKEVLS